MVQFTSEERERFDAFCELCDKITNSRFIRDFHKQSHSICFGRDAAGRVYDHYPRYDEEEFGFLMIHYRKLRLADEPTNLFKLMKLIKRRDPEAKAMLDGFKKAIHEEGKSWWSGFRPEKALLTQSQIEELILYGEVAHVDLDKRRELASLTQGMPLMKAVALLNYVRFLRIVIYCACETAELIREKGYLQAPEISLVSA